MTNHAETDALSMTKRAMITPSAISVHELTARFDTLALVAESFTLSPRDLRLHLESLPAESQNLVYRTAEILLQTFEMIRSGREDDRPNFSLASGINQSELCKPDNITDERTVKE